MSSETQKILQFAKCLDYSYNDFALLRQALTHRSYSSQHNERLEFLGDAVLGLCCSHWLMDKFPHAPEGQLSRARANLVCEKSLHQQALRLGLPEMIFLGEGEHKGGGRERPSILADALEALIGSIYLDGGYAVAQQFVHKIFDAIDISLATAVNTKDAKTQLQEWLQARRKKLPRYQIVDIQGAEHQQNFIVSCQLEGFNLEVSGTGASRKTAEQQAAENMLNLLLDKGKKYE